MRNLFYILMCCFAVSSVLADTSSELMNEKIHWSDEVITKAVEDGYKDYLYDKINSVNGMTETDYYQESAKAYEDKNNLLEALSQKGTFSLTDVVKQCTTFRKITPNYVCENVAKNFVDFISNPEWTEQTKTESNPEKK